MLYPQNSDHVMTIDSITSLHPMCNSYSIGIDRRVISITRGVESCAESFLHLVGPIALLCWLRLQQKA